MAGFEYDVVIAGASFGGVAAALAAASDPKVRVVLLEAGTWAGGQATSQGLTRWDETKMDLTETTCSAKSYRELRDAIRDWYRQNATLSAAGKQQTYFNPGSASPGNPFRADPNVVRTVIDGLLDAAAPRLDVKYGVRVTAVTLNGGLVQSVTVNGGDTYAGNVFIDATDLGDLLPLCAGLAWTIGAESFADTQERDAPPEAHPEWIQPITVPIALELRPAGESHPIVKPDGYEQIVIDQNFHVVDGDINSVITVKPPGSETVWDYRRYVDKRNFADPDYACDRSTLNVGSNDYQAATIPTGDAQQDAAIIEQARTVSIAFAYWLQTDVEHDDDPTQKGYPNLMVRTDAFDRDDGTAPAPYIRESRRIDAEERIVRQDIDPADLPPGSVRAKMFADSCGIGFYGIDVHPATGPGTEEHNFGTLPFQIPLGSLLPKSLSNFVAGCKNIGATHLTSGAYRVHPVEWAIGEAAGVLAAFCTTQNIAPKDTYKDPARVVALQTRVLERGAPIFWWADVPFENNERAFAAIHLCGVRGIFEGDGQTLDFQPGDELSQAGRDAVDERVGRQLPWPDQTLTRADAAVWICEQLGFL